MKFISFIFALFLFSSCHAQKTVCFTFDDLPIAGNGQMDSITYCQVFLKLKTTLTENKIPAIGFINESKLFSGDTLYKYRLDLIKGWTGSGLQLGNHTYAHKSYHSVPFKEYAEDIYKGADITKNLMTFQNGFYYFRPPFLHIGDSKEKADSLSEFLSRNNYKIAPVTIDNEDYIFAAAYEKAALHRDTAMKKKISLDYIVYMEQKLLYFEMLSQKLFKRDIGQVLLLHHNRLNADCLQLLVDMFKSHHYTFEDLKTVIEDPAFQTPISRYKNWGISWLERWAISQKLPKEHFNQDPMTPDYIRKYIE